MKRKRLKKLQKKAQKVETSCELSGLLTKAECQEFQDLLAQDAANQAAQGTSTMTTTPLRPSIHLRSKKRESPMEKTEGTHHRNLIAWILKHFQQQQTVQPDADTKKKRARDHEQDATATLAKIPHFASIHNPGIIQQLAVLQVHVPEATDEGSDEDPLASYVDVLNILGHTPENTATSNEAKQQQQQQQQRSHVGLRTKWFQGHVPKSMSESLLYVCRNNDKKSKKCRPTTPMTGPQVIQRLRSLRLTRHEMMVEGYPRALQHPRKNAAEADGDGGGGDTGKDHDVAAAAAWARSTTCRDDDDDSNKNHPSNVLPCVSEPFVKRFGVRVQDQDEEDVQLYIETPHDRSSNSANHAPPRVFGLDCEMVRTKLGLELARVTLLQLEDFVPSSDNDDIQKSKHDFTTKTSIVMDCLVKPHNPVVDYLTKYSGISAEMLQPVTTTLDKVQYSLAHILTPDDVLVGHSLENDLRALHYIHPCVIDTSTLFRASNKRTKFSLRHLARCLLKRTIQTGSHCSEEDAKATLDLALKKAWLGDDLRAPGSDDDDRTSILKLLCPTLHNGGSNGGAVFIGPFGWLEAHVTNHSIPAHALSYESISDCQKAVVSWIRGRRKAQLVWSQVTLSKSDTVEVFRTTVVSHFLCCSIPP
jgi:DNA polymerase III epsilon subunit-like protein